MLPRHVSTLVGRFQGGKLQTKMAYVDRTMQEQHCKVTKTYLWLYGHQG
jgi:hypothetical protein